MNRNTVTDIENVNVMREEIFSSIKVATMVLVYWSVPSSGGGR